MTDRERLIELYDKANQYADGMCADNGCDTCPYGEREGDCYEAAKFDYLIANGVTVRRWIPVTERLPEDEFDVLAKTEYGGQVVAIYDNKHKEWKNWSDEYREYYGFGGYMGKVTHWMPLPEPPEVEDEIL